MNKKTDWPKLDQDKFTCEIDIIQDFRYMRVEICELRPTDKLSIEDTKLISDWCDATNKKLYDISRKIYKEFLEEANGEEVNND